MNILFNLEYFESREAAFWTSVREEVISRGGTAHFTMPYGGKDDGGLGALPPPIKVGRFLLKHGADVQSISKADFTKIEEVAALWNQKRWNQGSLRALAKGYEVQISMVGPDVIVVWNAFRPAGFILKQMGEALGIPVLVMERAPWPGLITLDPRGSLLDTSAYRALVEWSGQAGDEVLNSEAVRWLLESATKGQSWWPQPGSVGRDAVLKRYDIPPEAEVVVFAGQVDTDNQNFFFNPHFEGSLDAFRAFVASLPGDRNLFVLGKHHPKSLQDPSEFNQVVAQRGRWVTDLGLEDAFLVADRIAGVNSALLFEASLRGKAVLAMGKTMLSECGVFHEWNCHNDQETTLAWLDSDGSDREMRQQRHLAFLGRFLDEEAFLVTTPATSDRPKGAKGFVDALERFGRPGAGNQFTFPGTREGATLIWRELDAAIQQVSRRSATGVQGRLRALARKLLG